MSTIVEAAVPANQFGLQTAFDRLPEVEFRMVHLVAHGAEHIVPFLRADCDDTEALQEATDSDQRVNGVELLAEFDGECLLRVDWGPHARLLGSILDEENAILLDASGHNGTWYLQMFFPKHECLSMTQEHCETYDIDIEFTRVNRLSDTSEYGYFGLTDRQYETLLTAYESGYYDVPRRVNQQELAQSFDVSHQAISERLRRAHETVITNGLYYKIYHYNQRGTSRIRRQVDS